MPIVQWGLWSWSCCTIEHDVIIHKMNNWFTRMEEINHNVPTPGQVNQYWPKIGMKPNAKRRFWLDHSKVLTNKTLRSKGEKSGGQNGFTPCQTTHEKLNVRCFRKKSLYGVRGTCWCGNLLIINRLNQLLLTYNHPGLRPTMIRITCCPGSGRHQINGPNQSNCSNQIQQSVVQRKLFGRVALVRRICFAM